METKVKSVYKFTFVIVVIALLGMATVGSAYAYSSSVISSNNTITSEYLTINVYNADSHSVSDTASTSVDFSFDIDDSLTGTVSGDKLTWNLSDSDSTYSIRVSTNSTTNKDAFVYGYYTFKNASAGLAIKSISFEFDDSTYASCELVRNAYSDHMFSEEVNMSQTASTYVYKDLVIKSVTINYYPGLYYNSGNISISENGSSSVSSIANAALLSDIEFHFLASRSNLLEPVVA